ncbi:MAG: carboxyl transferase domain-containing protein [Ilumatobacteraceae bacterium]|nr:carboxyl transferase domain-containing protein [Ilumatobacteraceae bacterium]
MSLDELNVAAGLPGPISAQVRVIDDRRVSWVEFDAVEPAAPLTQAMTQTWERAAMTALEEQIPFVMVINSAGADIGEGIAALDGWGRVARALTRCSGRVPTFAIVDGPAVSGPALLLGLVDFTIMTNTAYAFVNGPVMVKQITGIEISKDELGSAASLERNAGLPIAIVADREAGAELIEQLLTYVPDHADEEPPFSPTSDPIERRCPEAGELIPESSTGSYDVRQVAEAIVDEDSLLELRSRWAGNVVTAFATVAGQPVGIVANQPMNLAGTLDIPASQKAARFVAFCDAFNLPLITLVDTPGFYPGKDLEWRGMIRHGAQLVYAYGRATVPRVCVILRKSYGGAFIVMDSKTMGNDVCLAWPWAELAVMGAGQAAAILQRRATDEERAAFEVDYAERLLNPYVAAERGYVDAVIDPADTRREIAGALEMLANKRERLPRRKHGNTPL